MSTVRIAWMMTTREDVQSTGRKMKLVTYRHGVEAGSREAVRCGRPLSRCAIAKGPGKGVDRAIRIHEP